MQAWAFDKSRSLGQILVDQGAIQADQQQVIQQLVNAQVQSSSVEAVEMTSAFVGDDASGPADGQVGKTLSHADSGTAHSASPTEVTRGSNDAHFGRGSGDSGRFERLTFHDEGGLGTVWVAQDNELDRKVAIKEMKERFADDRASRKRFEMEAEITGALEHPGVVPVYGYGKYRDGRPFYAMRFIRGGSLKDAIEEFHAKDWKHEPAGAETIALRRLLNRFLDVCNTIYYAHRRGILHRDIKPSNVMLGDYGETLVVDWGLAKTMGHTTGPTESSLPAESTLLPRSGSSIIATILGKAIGSPPFMSPEQARGEQDQLGPETDIYSLGATLYTLLTNQRPVDGSTTDDVLRRVRVGEWRTPREVNPEVPRPLESICLKAMALKVDDRYPSVRKLAQDIENYLADEPVTARADSMSERMARFGRRHRVLLFAGAASLALIAIIATGAAVRIDQQRQAAETLASSNRELAVSESQRAQEARTAREQAEQAKQDADLARMRSDRVRSSLVEILRSPNPERDGRDVTVVEMLNKEVERLNDSLNDDPTVRSEMLRVIGETFLSLGLQARALELATQAEQLTRDAATQDAIYALNARAFLATAKLRNAQFAEALELCKANYKDQVDAHGQQSGQALAAKQLLAEAYLGVSDTHKAVLLLEDVVKRKREQLGASNRQTMRAMASLATAYNLAKRFDDAIKVGEEAHQLQLEYLGGDDPLTLETETVLANAYSFVGRIEDSIRLHKQALAAKTEKLGSNHVSTLESELALALAFITAKRSADAKPHIRHLTQMVHLSLRREMPRCLR